MEAGRRRVGGKMRRMKKISDMMPEETRSSKRQKARRGWVGGGGGKNAVTRPTRRFPSGNVNRRRAALEPTRL